MEKSTLIDHKIVDFIFEMGMLSTVQRSGNAFLGSGNQTIAAHSFRCAAIGYFLSQVSPLSHDPYKLLCMCLFHAVHETRTGELNYLQQCYVVVDQNKLWEDVESLSFLGTNVRAFHDEFNKKKSHESILAQDASKLELLFFLKEQHDLGNPRAFEWFEYAEKKLITPQAKVLAQELRERKADEWWKIQFSKPSSR